MACMETGADILLIDKPKGISSYDVIRRLRKRFRLAEPERTMPKLGHAGTLDPLATGLLIIGVGSGTKKLHEYLKLPKKYEATILLGMRTDTGDITGQVLKRARVPQFSVQQINDALKLMVGELELPVPAYSAIKQGGKPLYKKARRGESIVLPLRKMTVRQAKAESITHSSDGTISVHAIFDVESGTYIRSLAEELGKRLGVPAAIADLRRISIGDFSIKNAEKI